MVQKILNVAGLISIVLIAIIMINADKPTDATSAMNSVREMVGLPQVVKPPKISESVSFAGETIPLNIDTRERLDRELLVNCYYHSSTVIALKNASRYFPVMDQILAEEGVPLDFKYLSVAESNLSNVMSSAGASGFWQFMKGASKDYGLEINGEVDERYHLEKSTRAAARYLKHLKERFGSWSNAAAAYNMGPGNFSSQSKHQGEDDFFDLNLNSETSRYVFRLVAIKQIMANPEQYGFYLDPEDKYEPWNTYDVEVTSSIPDLGKFARDHGVSYRILKYYNPWLKDNKLTVLKNTYFIKFPRPETE